MGARAVTATITGPYGRPMNRRTKNLWTAVFSARSKTESTEGTLIWDPEQELVWAWRDQFQRSLLELGELEEDWNGYGGPAVDRGALEATEALVLELTPRVMPHVSPLWDGGVQVEWHFDRWDVEIEVHPDGTMNAYTAHDDRTQADRELTDTYRDLLRVVLRASEA